MEHAARSDPEAGDLELRLVFVLTNGERLVEHVRRPESLADLAQQLVAAGRHPERGARLLGRRPEPERPDPGDDVAPVVEMEVSEADGVDARPVLELPELREDAGAAVEEDAARRSLDEVTGLGAAGIRPCRRAADHLQSHFHSLAYTGTPFARCVFRPRMRSYTHRGMAGKIRVVIAKPGLDGHDRGAKIIARALRDAGMEVIYTGLHQTPEQIVETAIQEDADAVGISILSGAHMTLVPKIVEGLRENGAEDVVVVVGGTIPREDAQELKAKGVAEIFTPGAPTSEIVDFLREKVPA
jgi:methylmalonyl-CoA mutase C-terminal domain/subunit